MKFIKKPAEKFSCYYCFACVGNCQNDCVGQSVCNYAIKAKK